MLRALNPAVTFIWDCLLLIVLLDATKYSSPPLIGTTLLPNNSTGVATIDADYALRTHWKCKRTMFFEKEVTRRPGSEAPLGASRPFSRQTSHVTHGENSRRVPNGKQCWYSKINMPQKSELSKSIDACWWEHSAVFFLRLWWWRIKHRKISFSVFSRLLLLHVAPVRQSLCVATANTGVFRNG